MCELNVVVDTEIHPPQYSGQPLAHTISINGVCTVSLKLYLVHPAHMNSLGWNMIGDYGIKALVEGLLTHCLEIRQLK